MDAATLTRKAATMATTPQYQRLARRIRRNKPLNCTLTVALTMLFGPITAFVYLVALATADKPPKGADKVLERGRDMFHWLNGDDQ